MKKLLIFLTLFVALPALAATICADDDIIAIVLDPEITGNEYLSNNNLFEWGVTFPYGSVWGIATCTDTPGTYGVAVNELRDTNGELITGGERTGSNCWCKMTHPAVSQWVFRHTFATVEICRSQCPGYDGCAYRTKNDTAFRAGIFGSLGN